MGFLWHSPSEGPLSRAFTNYTHNTSYRPNAQGGPSSYFSQFLELCVATSKYLSTRLPGYPTTHVAVTYLVCVVLLYEGPTTRTPRITNFLVCVYILSVWPTTRTQCIAISWSALCYYIGTRLFGFGHLLPGRTRNGKSLVGPIAPNYV